MKTVRIIPRLDIKGPNLVKGIHLEGLRALGQPSDFAKFYYEHGADEILFMDVVASLYERNSLHDIISETAKCAFIPITVGGGIRTLDDIKNILRCGADKVSINTAAIKNPNFIFEASREFGSSTIVISIEAIRNSNGEYHAFIDNGREFTGVEVSEWAKKVEDLGCGEILITSVDREGTGKGFDIELCQLVSENVSIPVIAHGGAGNKENVIEILKNETIDAVSIASILHYEAIKYINNHSDSAIEGNFDFINSGGKIKNLEPIFLSDLKESLKLNLINCR
jgi:imidazole glycerol-phosphate synthase subunit HisF